jgi:hypothetical protein
MVLGTCSGGGGARCHDRRIRMPSSSMWCRRSAFGGHGEELIFAPRLALKRRNWAPGQLVLTRKGGTNPGDKVRLDPVAALRTREQRRLPVPRRSADTDPPRTPEGLSWGARPVRAGLRHPHAADGKLQASSPAGGLALGSARALSHDRVQLVQRALQGIDHLKVQPHHQRVVGPRRTSAAGSSVAPATIALTRICRARGRRPRAVAAGSLILTNLVALGQLLLHGRRHGLVVRNRNRVAALSGRQRVQSRLITHKL